jgi:hypothetical protein
MSLPLLVLSLVSREPSAVEMMMPRGLDAIAAAVDVTDTDPPLFAGPNGRHETARLLLAWSYRESRWSACAVGDSGRSVSLMQVNRLWLAEGEVVHCDARAGFRAGLRVMRQLAVVCGSVRRGLHAYAGGLCKPTPKTHEIVAARCALAGLGGC